MNTHIMGLNTDALLLIKNGIKTIEMRLYDDKRKVMENKEFNKIILGYKQDEVASARDMESYYSIEDIKKYGVVGIEVELK